ncbi:hypothetical protein SHDE107825_17565 [Shewanella denitrificans]
MQKAQSMRLFCSYNMSNEDYLRSNSTPDSM